MTQVIITSKEELTLLIRETIKNCLMDLKLQDRLPEKEILGVAELASLLQLSNSTIYAMVNKRLIPYYKKGKKLLFSKSEIIEWINSGRNVSLRPTTYSI
ncbi:MAG: helix-turn-helix domain-containing protein [Cytophagaceae bacterium]